MIRTSSTRHASSEKPIIIFGNITRCKSVRQWWCGSVLCIMMVVVDLPMVDAVELTAATGASKQALTC